MNARAVPLAPSGYPARALRLCTHVHDRLPPPQCYFMPDKTCPFAPSVEDLLNF